MERQDDYFPNKNNEYLTQVINSSPLDENTRFIQSYKEKKLSPINDFNNNKYSTNNHRLLSQINHKSDNYPYYFQYNDNITDDFLKYKKRYNNTVQNKYNSQIIQRNNDNLNWYESFKNSNLYKGGSSVEININNKIKENEEKNKEYFLQKEINEIAKSFKILNDNYNNNKYSFGPYLIKNKYAELF